MARTLPSFFGCTLGCDPELFASREVGKVRKRRSVIPSEMFVPPPNPDGSRQPVARDGVQVELHPTQSTCRESHSYYIAECFKTLSHYIANARRDLNDSTIQADFTQVVRLTPSELKMLPEGSRMLGCMPSFNVYGRKHIHKDGSKFPFRSAAGHIHIGSSAFAAKYIEPTRLVMLADVLVGIPSVMLDRDPLAAIRRKTYGRAGEYRLPEHGLEYRTLSNYWLRSYQLASLMLAQARIAFRFAGLQKSAEMAKKDPWSYPESKFWFDADKVLMEKMPMKDVEAAINMSDLPMATQIYTEFIRPVLAELTSYDGISSVNVAQFDFFAKKVQECGLGFWFPTDPLDHWAKLKVGVGVGGRGWESFAASNVEDAMNAAAKVAPAAASSSQEVSL